jgi:hypothetical protein
MIRHAAGLSLVTRTQQDWPGGGLPHFASIVLGRVAHVSDETSEPQVNDDLDDDLDDIEHLDDLDSEFDPVAADALEEAERAMQEARERLAQVPAEVVVTNHVMGLYELAAIHLSASPPDLQQSVLAIDAVACLVDGLGERLGEDYPTMLDALNNIRLAFVQIKGQVVAQEPATD